jgi:hypothetical protein
MMKDMPKETEQRIVKALEEAVKLANDGSTPDDALVKVAEDYEFPPEVVKRMVEAFNVSKTLSHLKHASTDERADSFPIASIENILGALYPAEPATPAKQASLEIHPSYSAAQPNFMEMSKEARLTELPPMTDKEAEPYPHDPEDLARKAIQEHEKIAKIHKDALDAYRTVYLKFFEVLDKAAAYWRTMEKKEPFDLVEKRAVATHGDLGKIAMDMIYEHGDLDDTRLHVKRAAEDELGIQQMYFDDSISPYAEVSDLVFLSGQIDRLLKEAAAIELTKHQHAVLNAHVLPPQPVTDAINYVMDATLAKHAAVSCPGGALRSKGKGRGLGIGQGQGPVGIPMGSKMKALGAEVEKTARDMPHFTEQDRPKKVKEIYRALKREHPGMPAEMKARIAARQGKPGKQKQGPPYKGPLTDKKSHELDDLFVKE